MRLLGVAAIVWALGQLALVALQHDQLHAFTWLGWQREHVLVAIIIGALGALTAWPRGGKLGTGLLAGAGLIVYTRWFSLPLGALAVAALLMLAARAARRRERAAWGLVAIAAIVFVAGGQRRPGAVGGSALDPCDAATSALRSWARDDPEARSFTDALAVEQASLRPPLRAVLCRLIVEDLAEKEPLRGHLSIDVRRRVIAFQRFRLEKTISAGVTPKRYFGFLDEQGDTAKYERALRDTVHRVVTLIDRDPESRALDVEVSELEVAVTFLAEGGALVLSDRQEDLERIHPVNGIGLDDFRTGFARHATLVATIDRELGTALHGLTLAGVLTRPMTFREAIAGTALMYLDEKAHAAALLRDRDGGRLSSLPPDRQLVITSLVYNSGILFSDERIDQILSFSTADYLADTNDQNRGQRPPLPVLRPAQREASLVAGEPMPTQHTSWNAVYHVLQRHGAAVALRRYTDTFDDQGHFR